MSPLGIPPLQVRERLRRSDCEGNRGQEQVEKQIFFFKRTEWDQEELMEVTVKPIYRDNGRIRRRKLEVSTIKWEHLGKLLEG